MKKILIFDDQQCEWEILTRAELKDIINEMIAEENPATLESIFRKIVKEEVEKNSQNITNSILNRLRLDWQPSLKTEKGRDK